MRASAAARTRVPYREWWLAGVSIAAASGLLALASTGGPVWHWSVPLGAGYAAIATVFTAHRVSHRSLVLLLAAAAITSWSSAAAAGTLPATAVPVGYLGLAVLFSRRADPIVTGLISAASLVANLLIGLFAGGVDARGPFELGCESAALVFGAALLLAPARPPGPEDRDDVLGSWAGSGAATAPLLGERGSAERIAHELRNLLTAASCHVEILGREPLGPSERRSGAELVCDALREATRLSGRLRPGAPPAPGRQPAHLNREIQRVLRLLEPVLPSGIRIDLRLDPSVAAVRLDEEQVHNVVRNLVLNAVEAIEGEGRIRIETRMVVEGSERWVAFDVCDDGCGMDASTLAEACDPHFSTKEKGSGLGLASVRECVESMGGRLQIASAPGSGTRVGIRLFDALGPAGLAETD